MSTRISWCDPAAVGWISRDPGGFAMGDANLYRAMGNALTDGVDPTGMEPPNTPRSSIPVPKKEEFSDEERDKAIAFCKEFFPDIGEYGKDWVIIRTSGPFNCHCMTANLVTASTGADPDLDNEKQLVKYVGRGGFSEKKLPDKDLNQFTFGTNKVVFYYGPDGILAHSATQVDNGWWVHKMGPGPVIMTRTAQEVVSPGQYAKIARYFVR
jgi:hypothetical protein